MRQRRDDYQARVRRWRSIIEATVSLGLLVTVLWWFLGSLQIPMERAHLLISAGRLAGLVAGYLFVVQVLLIARIPCVESCYGQDTLVGVHRSVGVGAMIAVGAHVLLATLGYADLAHRNPLGLMWYLAAEVPGMLLACVGVTLLALVAVLSAPPVRRRLRYESWHVLHLYAYLGVLLAVPHQLWTGRDFLAHPLVAALGWALWAAVILAVVWFRIGLPLFRNLRHRFVVQQVRVESPGVVSVVITGSAMGAFRARAGQFCVWRWRVDGRLTSANPFSLAAAPNGSTLSITVRTCGDGSAKVATLTPGTPVYLEGPYGVMHPEARHCDRVILFAGGVGASPIAALLEAFAAGGVPTILVVRAPSADDAPLLPRLQKLCATHDIELIVLTGPRRRRPDGRSSWLPTESTLPRSGAIAADDRFDEDARALTDITADICDRDAYVCGPAGWMDAVHEALLAVGMPPRQIHAERFAM